MKIDLIDIKLVKLLKKRFNLSSRIGDVKKKIGLKITDKAREKKVMTNVKKNAGKYKNEISQIFSVIIKKSRELQK
ncbi:MAG: chorismate mutase [Elusimicrobiota bacterium]